MAEMIKIETINSTLESSFKVGNWQCYGNTKEDAEKQVEKLLGYELKVLTERVPIKINSLEVYSLSLTYDNIVL